MSQYLINALSLTFRSLLSCLIFEDLDCCVYFTKSHEYELADLKYYILCHFNKHFKIFDY